jgi:15-cis-phytoene synthase
MGEVVATTTEPALGAIRLAWWRERLEELDSASLPAEPRLQAAAAELLPRGISGQELAAIEGGWLRLFDPFPWNRRTAEAVAARGRHLFTLAGRLLEGGGEPLERAGALWALVDCARHCSDEPSRQLLMDEARSLAATLENHRFSRRLRPVTLLAALAARDCKRGQPFEAEATPARAFALMVHRLTGRLPA